MDPIQDRDHLNLEVKFAVQMFPDSHLHVLCAELFCRTLCACGGYGNHVNFYWLVEFQGQLLRDYFRTTGDLAAALEGLRMDELAVTGAPDDANRAMIEHNCAIAINSMLARYPEAVVAAAAGRPQIREEGIAAAQRALTVYEKELAAETPGPDEKSDPANFLTSRQQVGRTHHLIGDLLRVGAEQSRLPQAIEQFEEALKCELPPKLAVGIRQSRGEAIAALEHPTREQLLLAEQDLLAAIQADDKRLARNFQWMRFVQLATVARKLGAPKRELMSLKAGAGLALEQIRQNPEEWILQQRSERMTVLFDELARAYAEAGQPVEALEAAETLRAATVRLHTMDEADQERLQKERISLVARDLMPEAVRHLFPEARSQPAAPEPFGPVVLGLLDYLKETPTACVSYALAPSDGHQAGKVMAFICGPSDSAEPRIEFKIWQPADEPMTWSQELVSPGPFREGNLKTRHAAAYRLFIEPVEPILKAMNVKRLVFSLPGAMTHLAFEALMDGSQGGGFLLDRYEIGYLPSLALGLDLAKISAPKRDGRMLVVGYQGSDLQNAAQEVEALRRLFGDRMTFLSGANCNKVSVLKELGEDYDFIHFACHGTYDDESPLNAALHLVPDPQDDRQRVTAGDILMNVKFSHNPVVTMSACSTALMSASPVNNCHGLTGSLLRAGARCVIGSRWPVYDRIAMDFMSAFYQKATDSKQSSNLLQCFADVQREMRAKPRIENFAAFGYMGIP